MARHGSFTPRGTASLIMLVDYACLQLVSSSLLSFFFFFFRHKLALLRYRHIGGTGLPITFFLIPFIFSTFASIGSGGVGHRGHHLFGKTVFWGVYCFFFTGVFLGTQGRVIITEKKCIYSFSRHSCQQRPSASRSEPASFLSRTLERWLFSFSLTLFLFLLLWMTFWGLTTHEMG